MAIARIFSSMLRFSREPKRIDPESLVHERWRADFRRRSTSRFEVDETPKYAARVDHNALVLELRQDNLFAWVNSRLFRYSDFHVEAHVGFDPSNGHSALGFVFRYINEHSFYSFLVSNRGSYRLDVVFNGNPIHLIEWTPCPLISGDQQVLRILAHGSHLSFYVSDEWIAEMEDETIKNGHIGFAAQNFHEKGYGRFFLRHFDIDSRPLEVERAYQRWIRYLPADPVARLSLSHTLFTLGNCQAAAVQLRKGLRRRKGTVAEHFLLGKSLANLGLQDEANVEFDTCLKLDPTMAQARVEKAKLLYLANEFIAARDYIRVMVAELQSSSERTTLYTILGNAEYALGNWDCALQAYQKADDSVAEKAPALSTPEASLLKANTARSLEMLAREREAVGFYLEAGRMLLAEEDHAQLAVVLARLKDIDPGNEDVRALEGAAAYAEDRHVEAEEILRQIAEQGKADGNVYYLLGMLRAERQDRCGALECYEQAAHREPSKSLFWFRLAESKYQLGRDALHDVEQAHRLAEDDPWINNLFGLVLQQKGRVADAKRYFVQAFEYSCGELAKPDIAPGDRAAGDRAQARPEDSVDAEAGHGIQPNEFPSRADIAVNLAEALFALDCPEEALSALRRCLGQGPSDGMLYNQAGNILSRLGDLQGALQEYEQAMLCDPMRSDFVENCAATCMELDMLSRADELLVKLTHTAPTPTVYNLLGNLARLKGEHPRAQVCYERGLNLDASDHRLKTNLASLYLERFEYARAKQLLLDVLADQPEHPRARELLGRLPGTDEPRL